MVRPRRVLFASILAFAYGFSCAADILYSFRNDDGGGVALVSLDDHTGAIASHDRLLEAGDLRGAHKLAYDAERGLVVVVNESDRDPAVWVVGIDAGGVVDAPTRIALPAAPDALCLSGGAAHIGLDNGSIVAIDLETRVVIATFDARAALTPPGHKAESFAAAPSRGVILVSFQKDSANGRREGNRVLVLRERTLALVADVRLPRTMPDLHNPATPKEQGPGPEVIAVCETSGAVLVTVDFYGALLPASLDNLLDGHVGSAEYVSAAVDGGFGDAFPDRVVTLAPADCDRAIVVNSGSSGGGLLLDFGSGEVLRRFDLPHGLELCGPTADGRVFAGHAGKRKVRARPEVQKTYHPRPALTEILMRSDTIEIVHHEAPETTHRIAMADADGDHILVVLGDRLDRIGSFDTRTRTFSEQRSEAFGVVQYLLTLP